MLSPSTNASFVFLYCNASDLQLALTPLPLEKNELDHRWVGIMARAWKASLCLSSFSWNPAARSEHMFCSTPLFMQVLQSLDPMIKGFKGGWAVATAVQCCV